MTTSEVAVSAGRRIVRASTVDYRVPPTIDEQELRDQAIYREGFEAGLTADDATAGAFRQLASRVDAAAAQLERSIVAAVEARTDELVAASIDIGSWMATESLAADPQLMRRRIESIALEALGDDPLVRLEVGADVADALREALQGRVDVVAGDLGPGEVRLMTPDGVVDATISEAVRRAHLALLGREPGETGERGGDVMAP
ncbi:MAG: FliH/SctL family protein [Actinomycetota bacterium]|nr:FliH/SctL family protein [Actinomycetota bacterium]